MFHRLIEDLPGDMSSSSQSFDHCQTRNARLFEFGGFDMQWSYHTDAGRKAAGCATCGVRTRSWHRPRVPRPKKLPYDFNDTYDHKVILSARAKEHFDANWPGQMMIRQIFDNAWEAEPRRVLCIDNPEDVILFSSQFGSGDANACPDCGRCYCQTFKSRHFRFQNPELIAQDGIFRTDISFGHGFRGPLWLAGPRAAFAISAGFREVWLRGFEQGDDGDWAYHLDDPFRVAPEPGAVEPTYPDLLE